MVSSILSLVFALLILFNPTLEKITPNDHIFAIASITIALSLLLLTCITIVLTFIPLQKLEQNSTPRLFSLLKQDKHIFLVYGWIVFFTLISFLLSMDAVLLHHLSKNYLIAIWIVLFGLTLDVYFYLLKRIASYLNPSDNILLFKEKAGYDIRNDRELDFCENIDSITEIAIKAAKRGSVSLCTQSLQTFQQLSKNFLESAKSIAHVEADGQAKSLGIKDRISYTLFYILDRITLIFDEALNKKYEQVISSTITEEGKIAVHAAKFDLTLTPYPVHYLTKHATQAIEKNFFEVGIKSSLTLLEVARTIIEEVDYTYNDLKDPFLSILHGLEEIAKKTFENDKESNLKLLSQPFRDLKILFQNPKVINHQDTPTILQNIDRVLAEYASLEVVMNTIPPIPDIPEENNP